MIQSCLKMNQKIFHKLRQFDISVKKFQTIQTMKN